MLKEKVYGSNVLSSTWVKVVVAFLPSAVFGLFLNDFLEEHFRTPLTIAIMLIVYGIAFIVIERWNKTRVPKINTR